VVDAIEGFCALQTGNVVTGWVRNLDRPAERLSVAIRSENGFDATVTADLFQADLAADRHCGFRCELPAEIVEDGVKVYVSARGRQVNNSPLILRKSTNLLDSLIVTPLNIKYLLTSPNLSVRYLLVDPIDTCNVDCVYCPHLRTNEKMDLDDFAAFLERVGRPHTIQLGCGQEPTVDKRLPRFFELIGSSKNRPAVLQMITNGTLLDRFDGSVFVANGLAALHLSIDTSDAAVNDELRSGTALHKILANVREFRRKFPQVKLAFSAVVSSATIGQVSGLVELGRDLGVSHYFFRELSDYGTNPRSARYTAEMPRLLLPAGEFRKMQIALNERWPAERFSFLSRNHLDSRRQTMYQEGLALMAARPKKRFIRPSPAIFHDSRTNVRIEYDDAGQGAPLVLLHGLLLPRWMWRPQIDALREQYRVITPDLRGLGGSTAPPGQARSLELMAADVIALLAHLRIQEPVVLAGASLGALVALMMARNDAARARCLILADLPPQPSAQTTARHEQAIAFMETHTAAEIGVQALERLLGTQARADPDIVAEVENLIAGQNPAGLVAGLRTMGDREDEALHLGRVAVPTLVIEGDEDSMATPARAAELAAAIPGAKLVTVPRAARLPNLEQPEAFNRAVRVFLRALNVV
jgi:pimeloyl-ACP methyl ester carboxylesterase/molybdenum cofactor biosynthesis enzyme MoaA